MGAKAQIQGFVSKLLPQAYSDDRDAAKTLRLKKYGEVNCSEFDSNMYGYAEEGSLIIATNPSPGAGLTWGFAAGWQSNSDTAPSGLIFITNDELPGGKSLYLQWVKLIPMQATTAATSIQFAGTLDTIPRALTTDNTLVLGQSCPNSNTSVSAAACTVKVQNSATASVAAAKSSAARKICRGWLGGFTVVGDEYVMLFGRGNQAGHPGATAASATPRKSVANCPPVIIAPGQNFSLNVWFGAITTTAANPEVEIAIVAR